jgi:CheY-like chemotaxis protein
MDVPESIANVIGDVAQLQMVLSAVLNNASEAMEGKGTIKISVRDGEIDEHFLGTGLELTPGFYVCIRIEDSGKGMDEETKSKIFDPFFTTKFQGRGLGMAAVYGIVSNHDGLIIIDSELGKGTVVRIFLPGSKAAQKKIADEHAQIELARGPVTILVVEDEAIVMDVDREMLKQLDYQTLEAKTGSEAITIVRENNAKIDLVLLDIKLPDMTGEEVYKRLTELRPELKVIVCSGYSIDGPAQKILKLGANGFIQKPFSIQNLSEKIRETLN